MEYSCAKRQVSLGHNKVLHLDKNPEDLAMSAEKSMADAYFNRTNDEKFQKLCEDYNKDPDEYYRKLKKYQPNWLTPKKPMDLNMHDYVAFFNKNWSMSTTEHFPDFRPGFKKTPNKVQKERFERWATTKMLIYTPGAHPDTILDGFATVEEAMKDFVENSGFCPNHIKDEWEIANEDKECKNEDSDDEEDSNEFPELFPTVEGG